MNRLILGKCEDELQKFPENFFDSIVTDRSGSTLMAAAMLGFEYVGIEVNNEYVNISRNRLKHVMGLFYTE